MKRLRYYIASLVSVALVASCSLEETTYTEIEKDKYMTSSAEAENVLLGVYRNLVEEGMYRYNLSLLFTIPSDIARCEGTTTDNYRIVPSNAYTAVQSDVEITWAALYNAVYDANDFIKELSLKVDSFEEDDKAEAAVYMAEARALRALFYFELVRWFGHITLMTDPDESYKHPSEFTQTDPVEVYEFIEKDLLYAIEVLPYASDDNIRSSNSFRFSKGAALGLLTKVYATWAGYPVHDESKWEAAAKTAKILVESGKHHLNEGSADTPGFEQLWYNTCNGIWEPGESLIEVSFYAPSVTGTAANDPVGRIGKWNGVTATGIRGVRNAGNWKVIPPFLAGWKDRDNDLRFRLSFADWRYTSDGKDPLGRNDLPFEDALLPDAADNLKSSFNNILTPAKWDTEKYVEDANYLIDQNMSNINWYILRYADVLLLYAEALNEWHKAPTSEAYEAVNMVRRRGFGLPVNTASSTADLPTGLSYEDFQQAVRDERSYELAFEGHRRQDLIRWGIYYETVRATAQDMADWSENGANYYICARYTQKNKHELLPIPQRDIDLMPFYDQNPGW